jgi:hypothetical protein
VRSNVTWRANDPFPVVVTDWLGQEYTEGDLVLYPSPAGSRSMAMTLAKVVNIAVVTSTSYAAKPGDVDIKVKLQPVKGSWFKSYEGRKRWIDTRTGKPIDPTRSKKHVKRDWGYVSSVTGRYMGSDEYTAERVGADGRRYPRGYSSYNWPDREAFHAEWKYSPVQYHDYVKQLDNVISPVVVNPENITKWEGAIPGAAENEAGQPDQD